MLLDLPAQEIPDALAVVAGPPCPLRCAAQAAAAAAAAFERRPTRRQPAGPASLLLATWFPQSWRSARMAMAVLRTHDADGLPVQKTNLLEGNRFGRDAATTARRALVAASLETKSPVICYAAPGAGVVVPRLNVARATVVGDVERLYRYAHTRRPDQTEIAAARQALVDALARDWPAEGNVWQAPVVRDLPGHRRLETFAALPGDVGPALARYDMLRQSAEPITVVRAGGLLLSFLPRKKQMPGLRLIDLQRA